MSRRRPDILLELSPDSLLRLVGELDDFDRGGRIRIYRMCTQYSRMLK